MDAKAFGLSILEYFISNIPTIATIVIMLVSNLKKIEKKVSSFDIKVLKSEGNIIEKVESKVNDVLAKVEKRLDNTVDKVDNTLDKIGKEVEGFSNNIVSLKNQVEHLFKTNKIAFDIIALLVSGNSELIEKGISSIVINKMSLTKEELENYPNLISTDTEHFVKAMKEQYVLLGKEQFEEMIIRAVKEIGYGEEK